MAGRGRAAVALIGGLLLAGQMLRLQYGEAELAALRDHWPHTSARATLATACSSGGRGISCHTSSVRLDFTDTAGRPVAEPGEAIDGSRYVPHGPRDAEGRVATTVVHNPAHPEQAQAAGALDQGVLSLTTHHWVALTLALVLLGAGISGGIAAWPRRTGR